MWRIDEVFDSTTEESGDLADRIEQRAKRQKFYIFLMLVSTALVAIFSMGLGSSKSLSFSKIIMIILGLETPTDIQESILINIRLPRVMMAIFAGAALATAGTLMQGSLGNPLVSPLTLGVASGASLGAALAIILGFSVIDVPVFDNMVYTTLMEFIPNTLIVVNTFIFSLIVVFIVIKLGELRGVSAESYILVGIAITFINGAIVESLVYFATPQQLAQLTVGFILTLLYPRLIKYSWDLNTLAIGGDDFAISTGVDPGLLRRKILVISAFATSIIIAFTGLIGFVGLAAPHIARLIVGNDYRRLVPSSALIGALLVLVADTIGGTLFSPVVLPVGIMLSIIGGPFFLYLLLSKRSGAHG